MQARTWVAPVALVLAIAAGGVATAAISGGDTHLADGAAAGSTTTIAGSSTTLEAPTTTSAVSTTTVPSGSDEGDGADAALGPTTGDRYWGPECGAEPGNHGQYVSNAPKGGDARSEAAQSECGKPSAAVESLGESAPDEAAGEVGDASGPGDVGESPSVTSHGTGGPGNSSSAPGRNK